MRVNKFCAINENNIYINADEDEKYLNFDKDHLNDMMKIADYSCDCIIEAVDYIIEDAFDVKMSTKTEKYGGNNVVWISHNGSRFDTNFIIEEFLRRGKMPDKNKNQIIAKGQKIVSITYIIKKIVEG